MSWADYQLTVSPRVGYCESHGGGGTYPIAAMTPILESVDMDGFSQVLTCALSTQSFRRVNTERAILPPRLRRLLRWEVEDVATVVSIAARAAGDRMSRECNLSMMTSWVAFCCFERVEVLGLRSVIAEAAGRGLQTDWRWCSACRMTVKATATTTAAMLRMGSKVVV